VNIRTLWNLWWSGNRAERVSPYRQIRCDDLTDKGDKSLLSKAKYVVDFLVMLNAMNGEPHGKVGQDSSVELKDRVFQHVFELYQLSLYPEKSTEEVDLMRVGQRSYVTVYDAIKNHLK